MKVTMQPPVSGQGSIVTDKIEIKILFRVLHFNLQSVNIYSRLQNVNIKGGHYGTANF